MEQSIHQTGKHAGKVWNVLTEHGELDHKELENSTQLSEEQLYSAIGWLAREDKVGKQDNSFFIGQTNLTPTIGKYAGMIWKILDIWEEADLTSIIHLARIDKKEAYAALGWLAREGKLETTMNKKKPMFSLKE